MATKLQNFKNFKFGIMYRRSSNALGYVLKISFQNSPALDKSRYKFLCFADRAS